MIGPVSSENLPKNYSILPETEYAIYTNKDADTLIGSVMKVMPHIRGLEIETEGGDRDDRLREEEWPWRSVGHVA